MQQVPFGIVLSLKYPTLIECLLTFHTNFSFTIWPFECQLWMSLILSLLTDWSTIYKQLGFYNTLVQKNWRARLYCGDLRIFIF